MKAVGAAGAAVVVVGLLVSGCSSGGSASVGTDAASSQSASARGLAPNGIDSLLGPFSMTIENATKAAAKLSVPAQDLNAWSTERPDQGKPTGFQGVTVYPGRTVEGNFKLKSGAPGGWPFTVTFTQGSNSITVEVERYGEADGYAGAWQGWTIGGVETCDPQTVTSGPLTVTGTCANGASRLTLTSQ